MFKVQTEFRGFTASHLKLAIFHVVYEGPEEGIIMTGFNNVLFAQAVDIRTGRPVKVRWEKGGGCVWIGPIKQGKKGIVKVRCEGW